MRPYYDEVAMTGYDIIIMRITCVHCPCVPTW